MQTGQMKSVCTAGKHLGLLISNRDRWWPVDDSTTAPLVAEATAEHALAFFDAMHSPRAMELFLEDQKVLARRYPPPVG